MYQQLRVISWLGMKMLDLLEKCLQFTVWVGWLNTSIRIAYWLDEDGLSEKDLQSFLKQFVAEGKIFLAIRVVEMLHTTFTANQMDSMLELNISLGRLSEAQEAAKWLGRELTEGELQRIATICAEQEQYFAAYQASSADPFRTDAYFSVRRML
jgi:hypothetical protein